ncbi:MAG: phospholipid carrier-dependent glycosyltransferase, partial [Clostridia bacterium]|nr:phospholipid carrier-dependent glycosyltransferase [Clostridia bacterium]
FFGSLVARYITYRRVMREGSAAEKALVEDYWHLCVKTLLWCLLFYVAIPFAIYFLSYLPYYIYEAGQREGYGLGGALETFWRYQEFMYSYHSGLNATHPYQSNWYSWPFTGRPMWYYFSSGEGYVSTMSASGNPAVWWVCTVGALGLLVARICRRVEPDRALWVLLVGVLANYLPWVLVPRCTFIYHFFATVPFLILAAVYLLRCIERAYPVLKPVKWVWLGLAALLFILLYPGLSGYPVSPEWAAILKQLPGGELMYGA